MAKKEQQRLSYSVLDRLLGAEYDETSTTPSGEPDDVFTQRLIQCIARDLQNLLNTRKQEMSLPEQYTELAPSIVDYGVKDLTTVNARSQKEREEFRLSVQRSIERYEPRLKNVTVDIIENPGEAGLIFHFNIAAVLMIEPTPLALRFDSLLPSDTRMFEVKGMV